MKIAVITGRGTNLFGGIETYIKEIYNRLAARGHDIFIYSPKNGDISTGFHPNIIDYKVPFLNLPHAEVFTSCVLSSLYSYGLKPDIVCHHGSITFLPSLLRFGAKKVHVIHGLEHINPMMNRAFKTYFYLGEKFGLKKSNAIIATSLYLKNYLFNKYNLDSLYLSPGAAVYDICSSSNIKKLGMRKDKYILYLGRITPEKGCHLLIKAFLKIKNDLKLVIAGSRIFKYEDRYYRYIKGLSSGDPRIIFTGLVDSEIKHELLSNALMLIYPALVGGLPLVILEAMGHKTCTVVSSICDYYPIINKHSLLFKTGSEGDLEEKIRYMISNNLERDQRVEQSYDSIKVEYSWDRLALQFEAVLKSVLKNEKSVCFNG